MAENTITYILRAVDNASSQIKAVSNTFKDSSNSAKQSAEGLNLALLGMAGAVVGFMTMAVKASADQEQAITNAARATANAAGGYGTARTSVMALTKELEAQGYKTEDITHMFTLLVNKAGYDVPTALSKTADMLAWAQANTKTAESAVRTLMKEEGKYVLELQNKNAELDATNSKISEYTDNLEDLYKQMGLLVSEERRTRDLNTAHERSVRDLGEAQTDMAADQKTANDEVSAAGDEYAKMVRLYGAGSEEAIAASKRQEDAIARRSEMETSWNRRIQDAVDRTTDIQIDQADLAEDIKSRQQEVNDKIDEYTKKLGEAGDSANTLTKEIKELNDEQQIEIDKIDEANEGRAKTITFNEKVAVTSNNINKALADLGERLIPVGELILYIFNTMAKGYHNLIIILEVMDRGYKNLGFILMTIVAVIEGTVLGIISSIGNLKTWILGTLTNILTGLDTFVTDGLAAAAKFVTELTSKFGGLVTAAIDWGKDIVSNILQGIKDKAAEIVSGASAAAGNLLGSILGGANGLVASGITPLASGGIITKPTLAILGEGGENEYVIPESKMGAPSFNLNLNVAGNIDEKNRDYIISTVQQEFANLWRSVS